MTENKFEIPEDERNKELRILEASYDMYEETKKTTEKRMKEMENEDGSRYYKESDINKEMELISSAQDEVVNKYVLIGGDIENLKKRNKFKKSKKSSKTTEVLPINEKVEEKKEETPKSSVTTETVIEKPIETGNKFKVSESYDVIPLPSKGECYKNKLKTIPVSYLTAYDENMIIAPNLYRDNKIIDTILKHKVLNDTIDVGDMLEGDRDAIVLFLRANGYGNEYPVTATDNITGEQFNAVVDLSKLKYKEFKLKGDSNGWFDFKLPVSGRDIKFRFLTHNNVKWLEEKEKSETSKLKKEGIADIVETLNTFIGDENDMDKALKTKIRQSINTIENWGESIDEENSMEYTHSVTNRLEMSIMSVDNITDRQMIHDFVMGMNVRDSSALRRYIRDNEPGVDYNITVEKPESLGGGSMSLFLQLDQYVFLNIDVA